MPESPPAPPAPQVPQDVEAEVIDLTGLSDEDDSDDWEDVRGVIDLTNLSSDDENDGQEEGEVQDLKDVPQNYTILNLPPRQYARIISPPRPGLRRSRRKARVPAPVPARIPPPVPARVPARVPVRRDTCELCERIVRWGPGCLITKHHLYPQQITKKYPGRYTQAQKGSLALLCRPCHDACHKTHSNRVLADFYNQVDLLKADPNIQAHISVMRRATTPELIEKHGDGVHVRSRKERVRAMAAMAARSEPRRVLALNQGVALSRSRPQRAAALRVVRAQAPSPSPPPPGVRRSARLLAKDMEGQPQTPVIVIEDDDEDMHDVVPHEDPKTKGDENGQDFVIKEELVVLEARGEYIPLESDTEGVSVR